MPVCVCVRGARQAPLDLLLLVYKCVQSVKLLLLRARRRFFARENGSEREREREKGEGVDGVETFCEAKKWFRGSFPGFVRSRSRGERIKNSE